MQRPAFGDAPDTSTDSILVVEGLLTHFITVRRPFLAFPPPASLLQSRASPSLPAIQRVVGAALEYAEDPLEVSKLDVLHVLRKNKRFLGRVVTTYEHLEKYNRESAKSKSIGGCRKEGELDILASARIFDDEAAAPAHGEAAPPAPAATRHDFSDAGREASGGVNAAPRVSIKVRKTA